MFWNTACILNNVDSNCETYFVVVFYSKDGTRDGEPLRYGQVFYLSTMDNEGGNVCTNLLGQYFLMQFAESLKCKILILFPWAWCVLDWGSLS